MPKAIWLMCAPLAMAAVAPQNPDAYPARDLIHSDVPLYTFDDADFWPRPFVDKDSWGCTSRIAFGDWRFIPDPRNEYEDESWYRFSNYGVFHCAAIVKGPVDRSDLDAATFEYSFFVKLGDTRIGDKPWELWAIQQGTMPGSSYILLARPAGKASLIDAFTVLQQQCPSGRVRKLVSGSLDIWQTSYCAINTRDGLLELSRRMVQFPPLGVITRVPDKKKPGDDAPGSPNVKN